MTPLPIARVAVPAYAPRLYARTAHVTDARTGRTVRLDDVPVVLVGETPCVEAYSVDELGGQHLASLPNGPRVWVLPADVLEVYRVG
jgi:hypothetical protein